MENVFHSSELGKELVPATFAYTASADKAYQIDFFTHDAIISMGYRVNQSGAPSFVSGLRMYCVTLC